MTTNIENNESPFEAASVLDKMDRFQQATFIRRIAENYTGASQNEKNDAVYWTQVYQAAILQKIATDIDKSAALESYLNYILPLTKMVLDGIMEKNDIDEIRQIIAELRSELD